MLQENNRELLTRLLQTQAESAKERTKEAQEREQAIAEAMMKMLDQLAEIMRATAINV
jgi:hypothetical protein